MMFVAGVAAALMWVAAIHRVVISFRGTATLWRWSFTVAVFALAVGTTTFALSSQIDANLHVSNAGTLLTHLAVGISAGGVTVYLLTLRSDTVRLRHVVGAAAVNLSALLIICLSWVAAPFHGMEFSDISRAPLTPGSVSYFVTWYAYLTFVLGLTAAWCRTELAARAHQRTSVRVGLATIGISTALGALGTLLGMIRVVLHAVTTSDQAALSTVLNTLYMVGLIGIAIGTVSFVLGPRLEQWHHHRTLLHDLAPLAARVRQLYPAVVLDEEHMARQSTAIRAQRLVIEISDGLRLLPVQHDTTRPASHVIADTLAAHEHPATGSTANDLLDRAHTPTTEQQSLIDIADRYSRRSQ